MRAGIDDKGGAGANRGEVVGTLQEHFADGVEIRVVGVAAFNGGARIFQGHSEVAMPENKAQGATDEIFAGPEMDDVNDDKNKC